MSFLAVFILFATFAVVPFLREKLGKGLAWVIAGVPALCALYFGIQFVRVLQTGEPIIETLTISQTLGVDLAARLDGLSLLFALLVSGIGAFVMLYASSYMHGEAKEGRFYGFLGAFMASMLGLVICDNLLLIFIFWELTSITSYLLIGWVHEDEKSRKSALQALLTTGLGGMALLAGLVLLGTAAGTFSFSEIVGDPAVWEAVRTSPLLPGMLVCILLGCFTKSAQFPFHYWLPNAMAAPTPVSAYLHSSTMVKAGVFLIARFNAIFDGIPGWSITILIFGGITMVYAAYMGSRQTILKRLLAYSTVSSLGLMVMLIGLGADNHYALTGAMAYLLAHALFKATLFLVAGILTHETGVKDAERLGGLRRAMPITFAAGLLAALSMAGVPLFLGFTGKEFLLKATLDSGSVFPSWVMWGLVSAAVVGAVWNVMIAVMVGWKPFVGEVKETPVKPHEPPRAMWAGPVVLASLALVAGVLPMLFAKPMVERTAADISPIGSPAHAADYADGAHTTHVLISVADPDDGAEGASGEKAGHGESYAIPWTLPELLVPKDAKAGIALGSSLGALAIGVVFFAVRRRWRGLTEPLHAGWSYGPERAYYGTYNSVIGFANWQTGVLQSGYLSRYVFICICATMGLTLWALFRGVGLVNLLPAIESRLGEVRLLDSLLVGLIVIGAVFTAVFRSRLAAVASLGLVGYTVATVFIVFGAPDVGMTQFAIETLTVIIFVLVLYHLPGFLSLSTWRAKSLDIVVASVFGLLMTTLVLLSAGVDIAQPISGEFLNWSYKDGPEGEWGGRGRNIINVILVDFRVIDTMGEIVVLGIAALGIYTLIKLRSGSSDATPPTTTHTGDDGPGVRRHLRHGGHEQGAKETVG